MRRFRFSIRAIGIAVAVIAIGLGILVSTEPFQRRMLTLRLRAAGVRSISIGSDDRFNESWWGEDRVWISVDSETHLDGIRTALPRQKFFCIGVSGKNLSPDWLKSLRRFGNVRSLSFWDTNVADAEITELRGMPAVEILEIGGRTAPVPDITDASVPVFISMPSLRYIYLRGSKITDDGVRKLVEAGIDVEPPKGELRFAKERRKSAWPPK